MTWPHGRVKGQLSKTNAMDGNFPPQLVPCTEKRAFHLSATWFHRSSSTSFNQTHWAKNDKWFKQTLGPITISQGLLDRISKRLKESFSLKLTQL